MKKRILALLLCIVMVLSITIITSAEDTEAPLEGSSSEADAVASSAYEQIMACTTCEELLQLDGVIAQEEIDALTDTQLNDVLAHINTLLPPLDLSNIGDTLLPGDETVNGPSQIRELTYDFTDAAPFGEPVIGVSRMRMMARGSEEPDNGIELDKTFAYKDGSTSEGTITLEAWATGEYLQSTSSSDVPTDIILVLDQSGSMDDAFDTVTANSYKLLNNKNMENYPRRQNGGSDNLWYKLADGTYVRVNMSITQDQNNIQWTQCYNDSFDRVMNTQMVDWSNEGVLYQLLDDGTYARCYVTTTGASLGSAALRYTYTYADGTTEVIAVWDQPTKVDPKRFYHATGVTNTYRYFYVDTDGKEIEIETSKGDDTKPAKYYYSLETTATDRTKLKALKDAVNQFAAAVKNKAQTNNVSHRIAVVGFASGYSWNGQNYNYGNTEVFIGGTEYKYGNSAQDVYKTAFQDMSTDLGVSNVTASINALDADGGTLTNLGLEMANGIFGANSIPAGEKRNRVVIVFTDGQPGWSGYSSDTASAAVTQANTAKNTYGATVYTVGIFEGANVNGTDQTNTFMRNMSSGTGYYLTASDSDALNKIFQTISSNIQQGGSTNETLDETTVVRDVMSDYFRLPDDISADKIRIYTVGVNSTTGAFDDTTKTLFSDAEIVVDKTNQTVTVSNFDYSENWVGPRTVDGVTTHSGKKLVIEFDVKVRDGFLGGNNVVTNGSGSAICDKEGTSLEEFESPTANVPIQDITITASDKNVYLTQIPTADQLKTGLIVKCGNVDITDPSTLADWQKAYVTIDAISATASTEFDATEDGSYTVSAVVSPRETASSSSVGTAAAQKSRTVTKSINVFKPELTFKDSEAYYGDNAPTDYSDNKTGEVWKHGNTLSTAVTMTGTAPTLSLSYTPDSTKISDGKINSKQDIAVDVAVKINGTDVTTSTSFEHTDCTDKTCGTPTNGKFWIHVKTCSLIIYKVGGTAGEPYVFNIYKDNGTTVYTQATIVADSSGNGNVTISELPVGKYKIAEDNGWSWRFGTVSYASSDTVTLSTTKTSDSITCNNTKTIDQWLNGFSTVVENIFGVKKN